MKFLHEFCTSANGTVLDNGWWKIEGNRVYNRFGGCHTYEPSDTDIIVECDDWKDLDWSILIKKDSPYGWISRDGTFYGCGYGDHKDLAELYLHKSEKELELLGYIKIYRGYDRKPSMYFNYLNCGFITENQKNTLSNLGFIEGDDFV